MRLNEFKEIDEATEGMGRIKKSPEEIRKEKQAAAAKNAQANMQDNPAPVKPGTAAFSNMASSLTPKQPSPGENAFSNMSKSLSGGKPNTAPEANAPQGNNRLTREWIQFLKNNHIVAVQSQPDGSLRYRRDPNVGELFHFLELMGIKRGIIANAIATVVKQIPPEQNQRQNQPSNNAEKGNASPAATNKSFSNQTGGPQPGAVPTTNTNMPSNAGNTPIRPDTSAYSNVSKQMNKAATKSPGVRQQGGGKQPGKLSDDPRAVARRQATAAKKKNAPVTEAFKETEGMSVSEKQVEAVFKLVMHPETQPGNNQQSQDPSANKKIQSLNKVKRFIRDNLEPGEVKALWRALTNG
jgi:hypothetical protein